MTALLSLRTVFFFHSPPLLWPMTDDELVIANGFPSINGGFDWSNMTLPGTEGFVVSE